MVIGGIALKKVGDVKDLFKNDEHPGLFPAFVIAIGVVVFIIAFFGCCGGKKNINLFKFLFYN